MHAIISFWSPNMSSVPGLQMVQHMFNCLLLPLSHTGSCPLRGFRSPYTPTTDQTNVAIFISAEGNHCKGTDPAENRALIAVPLKPNAIETDKPHPKVHRELTLAQYISSVQQSMKTQKVCTENTVCGEDI